MKQIVTFDATNTMQKIRFFWLTASLLVSITLGAQKGLLPKVQVGLRAGANYSDFRALHNSDVLKQKENTFVMVGAFAQLRVLKKFALRAELLSNPKGALVNYYDGNNVNVQALRRLEYTDLTLSAIVNFKVFGLIPVYAFGGYEYETLVAATDAINSPYINIETITKKFERNAESIIGGLGLRFRIREVTITPEIRYVHGLTDIMADYTVTRTRVFTASLGLGLKL